MHVQFEARFPKMTRGNSVVAGYIFIMAYQLYVSRPILPTISTPVMSCFDV